MNDNVRAWIDALRSGRYKQGAYTLRDERDCYCCLGVACDLAVQAGVIPEPVLEDLGYLAGKYSYRWTDEDGQVRAETSGLPDPVAKWLGGVDASGTLKEQITPVDGVMTGSLIGLNDGAEYDFEQIADVIEAGKLAVTS